MTRRLGHAGIDLDVDGQLTLLSELREPIYQTMFAELREDPRLSPDRGGKRRWPEGLARLFSVRARAGTDRGAEGHDLIRNGYFPSPDPELYAAMIVRERPRRIVEVGAGFSTLVARHAIDRAGIACELHVIDPEPRVEVADAADRVERVRVEQSSLAHRVKERRALSADGHGRDPDRDVEPGTLLFIDSSHVVEPGGDGPFLYCELLPSLPSGVLVHVHDVYLPYDYPPIYHEWGYSEQYVLQALLSDNPRFRLVFAAYFMSRRHADAMRAAFGPDVAAPDSFQGASFWLRTG